MNKLILPVIILISVLFIVAGMVGDNKEAMENGAIIAVTNPQQINDALTQGPVLVEIGTDRCPGCIALKPIMADISIEYEDKASVVYINADKAGPLAASFGISSIPDSFIIVEANDNGYIYMGENGLTTTNRITVRFLGIRSKSTFTDTLDKAIEYRESTVD